MTVELKRLQDALGHPGLTWLVDRLCQSIEQGRALPRLVTQPNPTQTERSALARLNLPVQEGPLRVKTGLLEQRLVDAELCCNLLEALEALRGPLVNRSAVRQARQQTWDTLFDRLDEEGRQREEGPIFSLWLERIQQTGLLSRLAGGDPSRANELGDALLSILHGLPAGGIPLAELAARTTGDSHALDEGQPLGTLCTHYLEHRLGLPVEQDDLQRRRALWAEVGVLCDELSAPVLVLNLRAATDTLTGRALQLHADAGEPYRISIRQLLRAPPRFSPADTGQVVSICENPSVLGAAANVLGARALPLICTDGPVRTAAHLLLKAVRAGGVGLRYHGDFDGKGLELTARVLTRYQARPWRMDEADYRQAAPQGRRLEGLLAGETPWSPGLRVALLELERVVHEEQVLETLLSELRPSPDSPPPDSAPPETGRS